MKTKTRGESPQQRKGTRGQVVDVDGSSRGVGGKSTRYIKRVGGFAWVEGVRRRGWAAVCSVLSAGLLVAGRPSECRPVPVPSMCWGPTAGGLLVDWYHWQQFASGGDGATMAPSSTATTAGTRRLNALKYCLSPILRRLSVRSSCFSSGTLSSVSHSWCLYVDASHDNSNPCHNHP